VSGQELLIERRSVMRQFEPHRIVPSGHVFMRVPLAPLDGFLSSLNKPGRFPPGLRASVSHLVMRAAARALHEHPHFNDFYLLSGQARHNPQVVIRLPLDAWGHLGFAVVADPGRRSLDEVIVEADARAVEERIATARRADKLVRIWRRHPVIARTLSHGLLTPWSWLRDHWSLLERASVKTTSARSGTFVVSNVGSLGITAVSSTLVAAAVAGLFVCAPQWHLTEGSASVAATKFIQVGVAFDLRLFEAYEAAAFLARIVDMLAEPARHLG
jgi:pyruvate/2-oxoglutarate dehydrogenase complex dihydrolipoamide acyltransferase (E2) component